MSAERPWTFPAIAELVPHAAPMIAIDRLVEWEPGRARSVAAIAADHAFAHRGHIDATAMLELMAQTVAACLGSEVFRRGEAVRYGMVIACRHLTVERATIAIGEQLVIDVSRVRSSDVASQFDGEVRDASGARIATGNFTLVHTEQPPARSAPRD